MELLVKKSKRQIALIAKLFLAGLCLFVLFFLVFEAHLFYEHQKEKKPQIISEIISSLIVQQAFAETEAINQEQIKPKEYIKPKTIKIFQKPKREKIYIIEKNIVGAKKKLSNFKVKHLIKPEIENYKPSSASILGNSKKPKFQEKKEILAKPKNEFKNLFTSPKKIAEDLLIETEKINTSLPENTKKKNIIGSFFTDTIGKINFFSKPRYRFYTLRMNNLNTGEKLSVIFYQNGEYSQKGLKKINHFLRDHRSQEVTKIDPKLLMLLYRITRKLKYNGYVDVISGYRSKTTNDRMRRQGRKVAKKSMHSEGKAIDIKIPGISIKRLRNVAQLFRAGGVGYYPRDGFIHIDTGPLRTW